MMVITKRRELRLTYHGRIIDQLGIQMYQSPVAAIAELVANAWDADAEDVRIYLPDNIEEGAQIIIKDDGQGMEFVECQDKFLNVGWARRGDKAVEHSPGKGRPVLGRKGIGKFAGFGIADVIRVETVSGTSGEKTIFEMDINELRTDSYVEEKGGEVNLVDYLEPSEARKSEHGTAVVLKSLKLGRVIPPTEFAKSMARRFLLHQQVADFKVFVNDEPLPESEDLAGVEFIFPRDYRENQKPEGLVIADGWGEETLPNGRLIKWRVSFYEDTLNEDELRGVAVFANGKLAQTPFFFQLSGGLGGQHGQAYISGQVQADYLDELHDDVMATERQRVSWDHEEARPLLSWGQDRVKQLLKIWKERRAEEKQRQLEEKLEGFAARLNKLPTHERKTVRSAVLKVASISTLTRAQFEELGSAILTAWEHGRLHELISDISISDDMTTEQFLDLLMEADVLAALNVAEAVRTKLDVIRGLRRRIENRELESAVRDYIAKKPWLLEPKWETFKVETSVKWILDEAAKSVGLTADEYKGRVDLALRSGKELLVVEFVRPGKKVDWDHLDRCTHYVRYITSRVKVQTALGIKDVEGLIVADELDKAPDVETQIVELAKTGIRALEWHTLLGQSESGWEEFLDILVDRAPEDDRFQPLKGAEQ